MMRRLAFFVAVAFQVGFLLGIVAFSRQKLESGFPVRLAVLPVKNATAETGGSVSLSYEISDLDLQTVSHDAERYLWGGEVYVTLRRDKDPSSPFRHAERVGKDRPTEDSFPFIRGRSHWTSQSEQKHRLPVVYGIERYYLHPTRAREVESALGLKDPAAKDRVSVEVRLDKDGHPFVSRLFIGEREIR